MLRSQSLNKDSLQRVLLAVSVVNLLLVSLLGLVLRSVPVFGGLPLPYDNFLHAHSHFAFGGWATPAIVWMVMFYFPEVKANVSYSHWRNIIVLMFVSAYGMLLSFPFKGYGTVSIIFSTLSIITTYYLATVVWKALRSSSATSARFLKAALVFLVISSFGAFAMGPLMANGHKGTVLYFDAIYFYLHFQYNGWFTFAVLSMVYRQMEVNNVERYGTRTLIFLAAGCVLSYSLSVLWSGPGPAFNIIGEAGAILQVAGLVYFLAGYFRLKTTGFIGHLAIFAFCLKIMLQAASGFQPVAMLAYGHRSFIIAYLHMVMLGFVTLFVFATILKVYKSVEKQKFSLFLFLFTFVVTELLLVVGPRFSSYNLWLFVLSSPFPVSIFLLITRLRSN